jgi:enoyl-CoA hydratase/carnithine racemase
MNSFTGECLSWTTSKHTVELTLHRAPGNEIGTEMLADLERFTAALPELEHRAVAAIVHSSLPAGFCAGADLRELHERMQGLDPSNRARSLRPFLARIHAVLGALDRTPLVTIAAVHGFVFGGGFELALACDLIVAERSARFCFPELRLGLIPGFGGIPRLSRDLGNALVRDLLLTGRSLGAARAHTVGLVSQLVGPGSALTVSRATAEQVARFDPSTVAAAKRFAKPIPDADLAREIDVFCELFSRPAVDEGLRRFVDDTSAMPYLPPAGE